MWHCVVRRGVQNISKDWGAVIFRAKPQSLYTPGTIGLTLQRHIPEDLNAEQHRCENWCLVLRLCLDVRTWEVTRGQKNSITMNFVICRLQRILSGRSKQGIWDTRDMWDARYQRQMQILCTIIVKGHMYIWTDNIKMHVKETECKLNSTHSKGPSWGLLWTQWWNFRFN